MARGTIKFVNAEKGWAFIKPNEGDKDLFVHATELQGVKIGQLNQGDPVVFEVGEGRRGPCAKNVRLDD